MKSSIHFHSDCPFFAGCENMLVNFFQHNEFMQNYHVSFSYRYSQAYQSGFRRRVQRDFHAVPLNLLDISTVYSYVNRYSYKPIRMFFKLITNMLLLKYFYILRNTIVFYQLFGKERIDLLHVNNGGYPGAYSCMAAVFAAKLRGIKRIVYVVNNIASSYKSPLRWLDFPLDRILAKNVSVFVTGSVYAGLKSMKVLKLPPSKVINIHNGIAPRTVTETKQEVLQRLGIKEGRLLIAVVAVLEERKGHIYLLKALKLLKDQGYDKKLPIVVIEGGGPKLQSLKSFVQDFGLNGNVLFIDDESNIFNLMNAVDVIVLPSISHEDFPNVVLEAMSLGKTVIASSLSGIPEQIEHMESGILVKPKDVNGLAKAIKQIVDNPSLCKLLGEKAFHRFTDRFLANISVLNYVKLYNSLLKGDNA